MAKYEKTRKYVVASVKSGIVTFTAPKGRAYQNALFYTSQLPTRMLKTLKVGSKVTLHRFSNQYTTYFAPKA
jgi:hypothetical protein